VQVGSLAKELAFAIGPAKKKKKKTLEAEATMYRDQAKDGAFMSAHATRKRWLELLDISTNISLEEYAGVVVKEYPQEGCFLALLLPTSLSLQAITDGLCDSVSSSVKWI